MEALGKNLRQIVSKVNKPLSKPSVYMITI
jgi:serine/threonine protein kinase